MSAAPQTPVKGPSLKGPSGLAVALRLYRTYLAHHWKSLALSMVFAAGVAGFSAGLAYLLGPSVKQLFIDKNPKALLWIPLAIVTIALVRADLAQLRSTHSGAHLSSILYETGLVRETATSGLVNYVQNALTIVATVILMFRQDVGLTLIVLIGAPIASGVMGRYAKRTKKAAKGAMVETSALSTAVMESLDGVKIVKMENREAFEQARVAEVVARRE